MRENVNRTGNGADSCAMAQNTAKRDARAFARWYLEQRGWPLELKRLATFAMLALKTLDCPKPAEVLVREAAKDLANFAEAYAAHMASREGP